MFLPGARYHLFAAVPFLSVFGLIPFTLYQYSGEEWRFQPLLLLELGVIGLLLYLATALVIRLLASISLAVARAVAIALGCLGLFALLAHVYAPVPIGPLDGSEITSSEPIFYTVLEGLFFLLAVLLFVQLVRGRGLLVASVFALAVLAITVGYAGSIVLSGTRLAEEARSDLAKPAKRAGHANVYHIVLDTMQTDAFLTILEDEEIRSRFRGFQLFRHNIANYLDTRQSAASYFTSTFYESGDYKSWRRTWRRKGIFHTLAKSGYTTWMYAPLPDWNGKNIDNFLYNLDIYEQQVGFKNSAFYDFLYVWLSGLAPNFLTNEALESAGSARDQLFDLVVGGAVPLSIPDGVHPYAGTLMLRRLGADEDKRPATGQYVYAHAALPHAPFVMDRTCRYVGKADKGAPYADVGAAYLEQSRCAVALLVEFMDRLESLGRYDAATIVVHADTGHGVGLVTMDDSSRPSSTTLGKPDDYLRTRVDALMMIKRPHAEGQLEILDTPTQLVDLFPTLLDLLDLPGPAYQLAGQSVYGLDASKPRQARFGLDPERGGDDMVDVLIEDQTDLEHSKLIVIGPVVDRGPEQAKRREEVAPEG